MKLLKIFMPVVLFLLLALIFTSNKLPMDKDYETTWKKVDSLDKLMQPRSALELVEQIYQQAKSENNTPQLIKANLYRIKLMAGFEENALIKAIHQIENEISTAGTPEKQLLHSIEAELYWRYYQTNRYKILNRTTTVNFVQEDIATWDARKLADAAIENYQLSLTDKEELQKINIESFKPILVVCKKLASFVVEVNSIISDCKKDILLFAVLLNVVRPQTTGYKLSFNYFIQASFHVNKLQFFRHIMGAGSLLESGPSLLGRGAMKCNRLFRRAERDGATRAVARRPFQAARSVAWNIKLCGGG